jgi:hemerythrin-like domain-containing protein
MVPKGFRHRPGRFYPLDGLALAAIVRGAHLRHRRHRAVGYRSAFVGEFASRLEKARVIAAYREQESNFANVPALDKSWEQLVGTVSDHRQAHGGQTMESEINRRRLIRVTAGLSVAGGLGGLLLSDKFAAAAEEEHQGQNQMEDVTPPEDLMREHGVLNRVLLIYDAAIQRFGQNESFDTSVISKSAHIIRDFIEDYHERNEEHFVFPRFKQAGKLVALVDVLYQQHQAGRRLTDTILRLVPASANPGDERHRLVDTMHAFIRMYRPHEAREDTVLFPALRSVVSPNEFDAMGEDVEKDEQHKFGQDGFEKMVSQVADLERTLGIHDLSKFTPT